MSTVRKGEKARGQDKRRGGAEGFDDSAQERRKTGGAEQRDERVNVLAAALPTRERDDSNFGCMK